MYARLFRVAAARIDAEQAHRWTVWVLRLAFGIPGARWAFRRAFLRPDPHLRIRVLGHEFESPVGLAAGFDKEGVAFEAVASLGFSFVEIGTVTAQPQPGNPRPRVFRLPLDRALINRMGFPNPGASRVARALKGRRPAPVLGINIGKTKVVDAADAAKDYGTAARLLSAAADYLVVNVSSPNTPGLRLFETEAGLRELINAVQQAISESPHRPPLLVKISPEIENDTLDDIVDLCLQMGLDGIVAVNTTVSREGLSSSEEDLDRAAEGGLSGVPLRDRSLDVLRRIRARAGDQLVLISVGGIDSPDEAWGRLRAGASLVQAYTGFVYGGPLWPARMQKGLAELLRESGADSLAAVVGSEVEEPEPALQS
jgi:dihydroorotate dehydrogenase